MKRNRLLIFVGLFLHSFILFAHDFSAVNSDGVTIYYTILSSTDKTVAVTSNGFGSYSGVVKIPEKVTYEYESVEYRVTSIGGNAFIECQGLTSITIPNSVTSIGNYAFYHCSGLTSITIPNSVTSIGYKAFWGCSGLESIIVDSGNTKYDSRNNCNAIIETATNTLISGCKNTIIPSTVTSIGDYAFWGCSGLTSLTIGTGVTSIGNSAFGECLGLTSITIPNSVTSIGSCAFENCTRLTEITIPISVTSIGDYAFADCSGLTEITIPSSVTSIGDYAFADCSGLKSIIVDSGNTKFDSRNNCNAIIETATNTLISGCKNTIIPDDVTSIGEGAFAWCYRLTSITIPISVTSIGDYAFADCSGLTKITIPNSVTSIGSNAFYYCYGLTSITIPNSVTSIGNSAFEECWGLTSITIPNSVTSIGSSAFKYCRGLTSITCKAEMPPTLGNGVFAYVPTTIPLYVPEKSVELYKAAEQWKKFNVIGKSFSGINDAVGEDAVEVERFDLSGRKITKPVQGVNIVRYSDGSVRKEAR